LCPSALIDVTLVLRGRHHPHADLDRTSMDLPPSLVRLAACQDGIVTRQQALQNGLTVAAVRHLLGRGGRWQRMVTGVYATFTGPFQSGT
jgi:hypothetical protein